MTNFEIRSIVIVSMKTESHERFDAPLAIGRLFHFWDATSMRLGGRPPSTSAYFELLPRDTHVLRSPKRWGHIRVETIPALAYMLRHKYSRTVIFASKILPRWGGHILSLQSGRSYSLSNQLVHRTRTGVASRPYRARTGQTCTSHPCTSQACAVYS